MRYPIPIIWWLAIAAPLYVESHDKVVRQLAAARQKQYRIQLEFADEADGQSLVIAYGFGFG